MFSGRIFVTLVLTAPNTPPSKLTERCRQGYGIWFTLNSCTRERFLR